MADHEVAVQAVLDRVAADDTPGVAAALSGLNETQRRAAWKALSSHHVATAAGAVAVLGTAPGAKSASDQSWLALPPEDAVPVAAQVLADRRPAWLPGLAARFVDPNTVSPWGFRVVRALVRDGVIDEPDGHDYVIAMVHSLVPWNARSPHDTVLERLRQDPGLLDSAVWTLLTTEFAGRRLAAYDHWLVSPFQNPGQETPAPRPEATWLHALSVLAADGTIDRARLLDTTLQAMLADWAAADVRWFVELHDAMTPTGAELRERSSTYLRLPSSEIGPVAKVGLRAIAWLMDQGAAPSGLPSALEPPLLRPEKGAAMTALALLEQLADAEPDRREQIGAIARRALDHPRADVRDRARSLVRRSGDADGRDDKEESTTLSRDGDIAFSAAIPLPVAQSSPVRPLSGADEVAEHLAHLIEEADEPILVERALDGVLRFANARPATADALAARAMDRVGELFPGPWSGAELRADLAALTLVWLGRARPGRGYPGRTVGHDFTLLSKHSLSDLKRPDWSMSALVTMRMHEVAASIGAGTGQLLSLPEYDDGSIPADVLSARLRGLRSAPGIDLELAILRVPPSQRQEIGFPRWFRGRRVGESAVALLASRSPEWRRVIGPTTDQWGTGNVTMVGWSDPGSPSGAPDRLVAAVLDRREPLARAGLEATDGEFAARPEQLTAMWPPMLPHDRDLLAAHAHPRLARALTKNRSGAVPVVEALGRSVQPVSAPTWSALTLAMAALEVPVRVAAIDAVIGLSRRGVVDATGLGEQIRLCLADDVVVGARVVDALAEAARSDRRVARVVLDVLAEVLHALPGRRDAHRWIELAADLSNDLGCGVDLPGPFRELAAGSARSVLAKACRRVRIAP